VVEKQAARITALEAALREARSHLKLESTGSPLKGWIDALATLTRALEATDDRAK
jgi:hypothetical protein